MASITYVRVTFLILFGLSCISAPQAQPPTTWVGMYLYQGSAGRTAGGSYIGEEIWLTVKPDGSCLLVEHGYMLNERIICRTTQKPRKLDIAYLSQSTQEDDPQEPDDRVSLYKRGETLFSLERVGQEGDLITHWKKMQAYGVKATTGRYFQQVFTK